MNEALGSVLGTFGYPVIPFGSGGAWLEQDALHGRDGVLRDRARRGRNITAAPVDSPTLSAASPGTGHHPPGDKVSRDIGPAMELGFEKHFLWKARHGYVQLA